MSQSICQYLSPFECSVIQSMFQCLSSFVTATDLSPQTPQTSYHTPLTSDLTPHTSHLRPETQDRGWGVRSRTWSILQCFNPSFGASVNFSVSQSNVQCDSPFSNLRPRTWNLRPVWDLALWVLRLGTPELDLNLDLFIGIRTWNQ